MPSSNRLCEKRTTMSLPQEPVPCNQGQCNRWLKEAALAHSKNVVAASALPI